MKVLSANGSEPELVAIRSVSIRGVPYDVFVATAQPPLTGTSLQSGDHGLYQATILTSSSLAVGGTFALSAAEWAVLANYEGLQGAPGGARGLAGSGARLRPATSRTPDHRRSRSTAPPPARRSSAT